MTSARLSRRRFSTIAAAASGALAAGAGFDQAAARRLAAVAAQNGLVEIEYWHRSSGAAADGWAALAERFNAEFDGQIRVTQIPQGDIQELNQKVRAAAAGGGLPAALMADDYDVTQYAANEIIVPLDDFIADPEHGFTQEELDAFLPEQINRHKLAIYDDRTMALPQAFSAFTTWWNVDALANAGFDGPPATWPEFPEHARAVGAANPGMAAWILGGAGDRFISVLKTYGVEWLSDDRTTSNFDRPEVLEIMIWWKELYDEGLLAITTESASELFIAGESAYFMDSSANIRGISEITEFSFDAGLPPQGPNSTEPRTETYGPVNTIPATTPEQQLAGWTWLKWLTSPEPLAQWVTVTSYFPSVPSVVDDPVAAAFYDEFPLARKLVDDVAPYASILSPSPALTEVRGQITADAVNEVLLGRLSPEEGVQKLKAEADAAITRATGGG